jgi:DtxR family Mn-dependent transcriptional regulator
MLSHTEENYLKAIFKILEKEQGSASTNAIAQSMSTAAASVTDMLKRLAEKEMIHYEKYKGVNLSPQGQKIATDLIRRHRLWEVFLVDKLDFTWDQIHEIAEQMEHVKSDLLIERLDQYLGHPKFDPHGDPIPSNDGKFTIRNQVSLSIMQIGEKGHLIGVRENDDEFLKYLNSLNIRLGSQFEIIAYYEYDHSIRVKIDDNEALTLSSKVCRNLLLRKVQ